MNKIEYLNDVQSLLQRIKALEAELAACRRDAKPTMFWNNDDPESPYNSIDEFLNEEWCQTGIEVGDTRTIQRAIRLTNVTVRVTAVSEDGDIDYIVEEKDAAIEAATAAQEKA